MRYNKLGAEGGKAVAAALKVGDERRRLYDTYSSSLVGSIPTTN
jgi:hypothetical protein